MELLLPPEQEELLLEQKESAQKPEQEQLLERELMKQEQELFEQEQLLRLGLGLLLLEPKAQSDLLVALAALVGLHCFAGC